MTNDEMLTILEDVLQFKRSAEGDWIDEYINRPFGGSKDIWRYTVDEDKIVVTNLADKESVCGSFKQFLWDKLRLDSVCEIYKQQYGRWMELNYGIPYVETDIVRDSDEGLEASHDFIRSIWNVNLGEKEGGLKLLMAEYGMGKSSFCHGVRLLASEEIKKAFLNNDASFPFVFDLNEYRNSAFDEFVKNRLSDHYGVNIKFRTFEKLCRTGIFSVVLDAWDQMHDTPVMRQTRQDISQFSALWKNKGRVLITCRRSFYQKQLHMKKDELFDTEDVQAAKFYTLAGFNERSAKDYFVKANEILEKDGRQPIDQNWVKKCWEINSELFSRPLNIKLLVKHFDAITAKYKLADERLETYQFLQIILARWQTENDIHSLSSGKDILKALVMLTLESGLNRSVSIDNFKRMIKKVIKSDDHWERIKNVITKLDFVSIGDDGQIEFRLAAYQEFLWAQYVLDELEEKKLCGNDKLLNRFMLPQEVRSWIARELSQKESDCLETQLKLVKYKIKAEVGYSGSNAITLLRDLNNVDYYKEQFLEIARDLAFRPFEEADLRGLNLTEGNFEGSSFIGADLSYTKLDKAVFSGANLSEVTWEEYGRLQKCAFLNDSVVVGTESGSLLTFSIADDTADMQNLADETIMDVAADLAGVYTASQDGWISYIKNGQLKHAYIVESGLQSIGTSSTEGSVYVGANREGLYRYNWNSGSYRKIHVTDDGIAVEKFDVADIHYFTRAIGEQERENLVAYISDNNKSLVLVQIQGKETGFVEGKCILKKSNLKFGDICFADDFLVYSVVGKGVYHIPVDEMDGKIEQEDLLNDRRCLYECVNPVELAWVKAEHILLIIEKAACQLKTVNCISFNWGKKCRERDIEWIFDQKNYAVSGEKVEGFCVSNDGKYIALSGEKLVVLELVDNDYYQMIREPIEAKISCNRAEFKKCTGLTENRFKFLEVRGAIIEKETEDE